MKRNFIVFLFLCTTAKAQLQNTWMMGHFLNPTLPKCGLDFSNGAADTFSLFRPMPFYITNSIISDSLGQLLFYSNGEYVANRNNDTLLNSNNFNPGFATSQTMGTGLNVRQGILFLPFEKVSNKYIIIHCSLEEFTINNNYYNRPFSLRFSEVDLNLDNSLGGIVAGKKSVSFIVDTLGYGKITACKHGNGRDWWVISRKFQTNKIYISLVTPDTITVTSQTIGSIPLFDVRGQAEFSPDGSKYAILTQNHLFDIFDFDRCSGVLSNPITLNFPDTIPAYVGCSFSPDSRYLYANSQLAIYQFDLWSNNIDSSIQTVALWDTVASPFYTYFSLNQLANDGKIYIGTSNGCDVLHCINSPDSAGLNSNVLQNYIKLPSRNTNIPNYPNYGLGALTGSFCDSLTQITSHDKTIPTINLFPNPANSFVNITYQFKSNEQALFTLYNSLGDQVMKKNLYGTFKSLLIKTDVFPPGVYYFKVDLPENKLQTGKLIVVR